MSEMENKKNTAETPKRGLFSKLFGKRVATSSADIMKEEQIQSPFRAVVRTFRANKLSMGALIVFLIICIVMFLGPIIRPVALDYTEITQLNLPPGRDMMKFPDAMKSNPKEISVGRTYGIGIDANNQTQIWGKTELFAMPDLSKIPAEAKSLKKVAAGFDHALGLTNNGKLVTWGNNRQRQATIPGELKMMTGIKEIYAGYKTNIALTEEGKAYFFGNDLAFDWSDAKAENLSKVALSDDTAVGLTKDGKIVFLGNTESAFSKVPESNAKFVDVVAGASTFAALDADGKVYVWGNTSARGEGDIPKFDSKPVSLAAGRYHFAAVLENGNVKSWGDNTLGQRDGLDKLTNVKKLTSGYYQNYAVDKSGNLNTAGLKGYLLGTDDFGRDIFIRILNGGRLTLTIGSLAVLISTIIGMILGGVSGYFGGKVDMILQRFGEVVSALPFLPTVIILNSVIGNRLGPTQRVYLIMVLLGLLSWTGLMRLVRAQVLSLREQEFVTAARALGIKEMNIVFKHIIPNTISIIIVSATLSFATSLLTEASLSFLGFGVLPPQPTWGNMLNGSNNSTVVQYFWWRWVYTSAILSVCVICINLIGTGLDDAINPKSQER